MTIVRNILAVIVGLFIGSSVNMGLILLGHQIFPLAEGIDPMNMEALIAAMPSFGPEQFLFPFLAHALGTFVGAFVAAKIAASHKATFAMVIGYAFLAGGIINVFQLPAPIWFSVIDLILAYVPMAWLASRLAVGKTASTAQPG